MWFYYLRYSRSSSELELRIGVFFKYKMLSLLYKCINVLMYKWNFSINTDLFTEFITILHYETT